MTVTVTPIVKPVTANVTPAAAAAQFEGPVQTQTVVVSLKLSKLPSIASGGALGTADEVSFSTASLRVYQLDH